MTLMDDMPLIVHGRFGAAVRHLQATAAPVPTASSDDLSACTALVMGQADLDLLKRTASASSTPLVAGFLCGRYLVVTPRFEAGRPCAQCFSRRFVSSPPPGMDSEAILALTSLAGAGSGFDPVAYAPSAVALALLLLRHQMTSPGTHAILVDQAGLRHVHAPLRAVHGCRCRGNVDRSERFVGFSTEVFQ